MKLIDIEKLEYEPFLMEDTGETVDYISAEAIHKAHMHLVRLYLMCIDILEKEEIITYREADHDLLMSIRNGAFQNEDSTYKPEFFEIIDDLKKQLDYAKENTSLPAHPDMKRVEEFVMSVNRRALNG